MKHILSKMVFFENAILGLQVGLLWFDHLDKYKNHAMGVQIHIWVVHKSNVNRK